MSGNVWDWTRSIYKTYPYLPSDGRERTDASADEARVLRGAAFNNSRGDVRCSSRVGLDPSDRYSAVGFRVNTPTHVPLSFSLP